MSGKLRHLVQIDRQLADRERPNDDAVAPFYFRYPDMCHAYLIELKSMRSMSRSLTITEETQP